jgi:hypothetical protein
MPRLTRRGRDLPWKTVLALSAEVAREGKKRWDRLSTREQRQIRDVISRSRGRLDRISQRDRQELRRIIWKAVGPQ